MSKKSDARRSEKAGILNFSKEMVSAFLMAFVFIVYIIQAFKIPTGSMENSLLAGDFLLGLKFIYGAPVLPFSYTKLPGVLKPKAGDVLIFKYPGKDNKDYIKRCVAGPGQTIEIKQQEVYLDGKLLKLPPAGKYSKLGLLQRGVQDFKKLRIPAKGDTLHPTTAPIREFLFYKHLIHQENPELNLGARVQNTPILNRLIPYKFDKERTLFKFSIYVNGEHYQDLDDRSVQFFDNWQVLDYNLTMLKKNLAASYQNSLDTDVSIQDSVITPPTIEIKKEIYLDGKKVDRYIVKKDNYFMMGDNRDNSLDSRYWGFLNKNFLKAKAFIIYFSWADYYEEFSSREEKVYYPYKKYHPGTKDPINLKDDKDALKRYLNNLPDNNIVKWYWDEQGDLYVGKTRRSPIFALHNKIRWNRIGKLIRSWDGL